MYLLFPEVTRDTRNSTGFIDRQVEDCSFMTLWSLAMIHNYNQFLQNPGLEEMWVKGSKEKTEGKDREIQKATLLEI